MLLLLVNETRDSYKKVSEKIIKNQLQQGIPQSLNNSNIPPNVCGCLFLPARNPCERGKNTAQKN